MKFSSYHPVINLIYFAAALTGIILFRHPVFLAISFAASFAWSVKLRGKRGLIFDLCLVPLILLYAGVYASYNHFGVTDLAADFIGNEITLESIVYGLVLGTTAAAFLMMFSCFLAVFSVDKIVYLLERSLRGFLSCCRWHCGCSAGCECERRRSKRPGGDWVKACTREASGSE